MPTPGPTLQLSCSVERNTAVHNGTANDILTQGLQGLLALTLCVQAGSHYVDQARPQHLILLLLPQFLNAATREK